MQVNIILDSLIIVSFESYLSRLVVIAFSNSGVCDSFSEYYRTPHVFEIMSLEQICLVIDFDGFMFGKKFLVREMGYCSLISTRAVNDSIRFDLTKYWNELTERDKKTNLYITRNIHGLSFRPFYKEHDCFPEEYLTYFLENLYRTIRGEDNSQLIVAYKGGIHEKRILDELNIPSINLEKFGCPKYDNLLSSYDLNHLPVTCGYHSKLTKRNTFTAHCAKSECLVFAQWIQKQIGDKEQYH